MVADADVLLRAGLVQGEQQLGRNFGVFGHVVDDARLRCALDVIDVGLIQRPGVDQALRPVLVINRPAVETKNLGLPIRLARGQPGVLGRLLRLGRGVGHEGLQRGLQSQRRLIGVLISRMNDVGVIGDHLGLEGVDLGRAGRRFLDSGCGCGLELGFGGGGRDLPATGGRQSGQCHHHHQKPVSFHSLLLRRIVGLINSPREHYDRAGGDNLPRRLRNDLTPVIAGMKGSSAPG